MTIQIKIKANSKIDKLFYDESGKLNAKIKAPAQDGKANEYLIGFLAKCFDVPKSNIKILSGFTNPNKRIDITGVNDDKKVAI